MSLRQKRLAMKEKILFGFVFLLSIYLVTGFTASKERKSSVPASVAEEGIQFFKGDWNTALQEAKKQDKLIFLDAYALWCGPCRMLKRNTFPDQAAGEFFNKHFINIAVDMEKGNGPVLAEQYKVNAYPTLIIVDSNGKLVSYTKGYINAKQLISFGKYGVAQYKK